MSKSDLEKIKHGLNGADLFVDDALDATRKAGDHSGEERVKKLSEHVKEVKKSFDDL